MKNKISKTNLELNKLPTYINEACKNCGRKYPETVLNIEERVHHSQPNLPNKNRVGYRCVDTNSCSQARRKIK